MPASLLAATDTLAVGVTVIATLVIVCLLVAIGYLLKVARELRRQALELAQTAEQLLDELGATVRHAGMEVERVERMVGSAEAISDAVGSASRLVGGALAGPFIKLVALGSGAVRMARLVREGGGPVEVAPPARERRRPKRGRAKSIGTSGRSLSRIGPRPLTAAKAGGTKAGGTKTGQGGQR
jgi:hypothetical protein